MGRIILLSVNLFLVSVLLSTSALAKNDWPVVGQDLTNDGNQEAEKSLGVDNVFSLEKKWQFDVPTELGVGVSAQPAYFDGVLYFGSAADTTDPHGGGTIYAVDAATGELIWSTTIAGASFATTPAVPDELLYIAEFRDVAESLGGVLFDATAILKPSEIFCLRRSDGEIVWSRALTDSELPSTLSTADQDVPVNRLAYAGDTTIVGRRVIVGVGSVDIMAGDTAARGSVVAFDRFTGKKLWRFWTTSDQALDNPEFGGGVGAWSSPGVDRRGRLLFIGTGQSYECPPEFETCPPESGTFEPGSLTSPFSDALLALDYRTGELLWHRQFTPDDVWGMNTGFIGPDHDVSTHPNLFAVRAWLPGEARPKLHRLVGVGDKAGDYHILKRHQETNIGEILKTIDMDPGGNVGGFQSTPAFDNGVLYMATHAKVQDGQRLPTRFPLGPSDRFSTKIAAIDIARLLEQPDEVIVIGETIPPGQEEFILWLDVEEPTTTELAAGFTFGPLTIANDVLYHTSSTGFLRALDAQTGEELFRDVPLRFDLDVGAPEPASFAVPIYGGATIADGMVYVGVGVSFFGFPPATTSALVAYGLP